MLTLMWKEPGSKIRYRVEKEDWKEDKKYGEG